MVDQVARSRDLHPKLSTTNPHQVKAPCSATRAAGEYVRDTFAS
jgi:hypothetical protein